MTKQLTNSEMKCWRRCKRQWYLAYHRGLGRKRIDFNKPLGIGNRVHDALAAYYDPNERIDPLEHIRTTVASDLERFPAQAMEITKEGELATIMLEGYVQWCEETGVDQGMTLLHAEDKIEVPLADGLNLLTKLDAEVRMPDGARLNLEHKTADSLKIALPTLQLDTQCLTEHLAQFLQLRSEGREDERADGVLYNILRKVKRTAAAKPPFYSRVAVRHNINELRSHWEHVMAIAQEIRTAEEALLAGGRHQTVVHPSPTRDCSWDCQFFPVCPLMDDGSDFDAATAELYETVNPLERYAHLGDKEADL